MKKSTGKRGNGGFSLVELIIVIAIMAVLVGVLAPQYLSYIHKAKVAADQANLKNYFTEILCYFYHNTEIFGVFS